MLYHITDLVTMASLKTQVLFKSKLSSCIHLHTKKFLKASTIFIEIKINGDKDSQNNHHCVFTEAFYAFLVPSDASSRLQ